jgi:MFS family permease
LAAVFSISGVGGLAGSLLANWLRGRWGLGKIFGTAAVFNGIAYAGMYLCTNAVVLTLSLFIMGLAISLHNISVYTFRHEQTPPHLMGRIGGITGTLFRLGMPITMYFAGWMMMWWALEVVLSM